MYPKQDTSSMETAGVKQEEAADTRIIVEGNDMKYGRKERGHCKGKNPKQGLTSVKELTIELPKGREFPYHKSD